MTGHPRVLFITPHAFNGMTGGGITFSALFRGWPRDRLATVHNDAEPTTTDVCARYYELGPRELDLIPPLDRLRRHHRARSGAAAEGGGGSEPERPSLLNRARRLILGDALPERARLTPELEHWIAEFRPELLYTILGSNGMMSLIEQVRRRFRLPLAVHVMDDWATTAYRTGLVAQIERLRLRRLVRHFFSVAECCLGISPAMCAAYGERYGRRFTAFQNTIEVARWSGSAKRELAPAARPELLYVGSIFPNAQLSALTTCARAVAALNAEGLPVGLSIASPSGHGERYRRRFELHDNIRVIPPLTDDAAFFTAIAGADALLLPVNFDRESVAFIRYSMPTKVPAYLVSGTPVLVYGPAETAQVRYALDSGWGHVVAEPEPEALKQGIRRILGDIGLRRRLSEAARAAALTHDAAVVRRAFQDTLCAAAGHSGAGGSAR